MSSLRRDSSSPRLGRRPVNPLGHPFSVGVEQPGSSPGSHPGGRRFESARRNQCQGKPTRPAFGSAGYATSTVGQAGRVARHRPSITSGELDIPPLVHGPRHGRARLDVRCWCWSISADAAGDRARAPVSASGHAEPTQPDAQVRYPICGERQAGMRSPPRADCGRSADRREWARVLTISHQSPLLPQCPFRYGR